MNKKYEFTDETIVIDNHTLHRIRAIRTFGGASEGDLGGFIEADDNLSHVDGCWIHNEAKVYDGARISENGRVFRNAIIHGDAEVRGYAKIGTNAYITSSQDYVTIGPLGSRNDTTTFYKTKEDIMVVTGCFCDSIKEFEKAVTKAHKNDDYAEKYFQAIAFVTNFILKTGR